MSNRPNMILQAEEESLQQDLAHIEAARTTIDQDQSLIDAAAKEENAEPSTAQPFWEKIAEIGAEIPESEWAKIPRDLATNFEYYMYGAPKEE
ncbi:hypothetical protein [Microseira wollei]|uniref:Uncharacterized protein n=1 Tax=Microseira wollei NIES-4236 TaxID=2530354 RepID=A0AAV3XPK2_9CYAN|nr:hypothetical protein [Microseira wollei]GET41532.1 hypothetical protein MiSe_63440 [Microseira wollei NIES-4236]